MQALQRAHSSPFFSESDRIQICQDIMTLPEFQVQYVVRLIQTYAPHVLKLENKQWVFDTKALSNELLMMISDYLLQHKSVQGNLTPSGGLIPSQSSSYMSVKKEDGSSASNSSANSDTNMDATESKETESESNIVAHAPPPLLSNFSFGNKLSKASFSLSKLSIDLDINLLQNLNSLSKGSFSRGFSKDFGELFDSNTNSSFAQDSTFSQFQKLQTNDQPNETEQINFPRYSTRAVSKANVFSSQDNDKEYQFLADPSLPIRKQVSFSNLVSSNSAPPNSNTNLTGAFNFDNNINNFTSLNANCSDVQNETNLCKRRLSEYPTKSMDVLTSLISEPLQVTQNLNENIMQNAFSSMENNFNVFGNVQTDASNAEIYQSYENNLNNDNDSDSEDFEEDGTLIQKNKRRKKNCPRQPVNKKSLSELQLQGYFHNYEISQIPIFKHIDKSRIKRLLCFECGKTFRGKSEVVVHVRTHTGEKPLFCKYCKKRFAHPSNLKVHERSHRKEKPFKCSVERCNKEFAHNMSLKEHLKSHDDEIEIESAQNNNNNNMDFTEEKESFEELEEKENELKEESDKESVEKKFRCVHCKHGFDKRVELIKHVKLMHGR